MIDWGSWRSEPILVGALVLLGWLYALATGPLRARLAPWAPFPRREAARFGAGLGLLYLAWGSPLDLIGRYYLCSVHAALDLLVLFPAAMLLLRGLPAWLTEPALARARPAARLLFHPVVASLVFVLVVSGSYLPRPFEAALRSDGWRAAQAAVLLAAALLFWRPLLSRSAVLPPPGYGGRLAYLFATEVSLTGVFTYILMAEHGMYPTYEHAPRLVAALTPYEDQVLAGVLLSAVSSVVLVGTLGLNFYRWYQADQALGRGPVNR
ncbi:MAG TPA: cytochrome c oxidase assembly protein [Opitutaceae bacterium]|nr:cytochrome c oxidase assembly protein [Opitutaceae bacterium]